MDRKTLVSVSILMLLAAVAEARPPIHLPVAKREMRYRPGELLVLAADPHGVQLGLDGRFSAVEPGLEAALERHGLTRYRRVGPARPDGPSLLVLSSDRPDFDVAGAAAELRKSGAFRAVAPNLRLDLYETVPNDPFLPYQWQIDSFEGSDVQLTDAWDVWKGDTSTVIAIIDNGIDVSHPDLASQVWINRGEIPANGIDDDANGYVDDVRGWDFGDHDNDPSSSAMFDSSGLDVGFHGTFVAGIAAAATNNDLGIAGAGWNCRLMPLKVADSSGEISLDAVAEAMLYVVARHPAVVNMSFGTDTIIAQPFFQELANQANAANVVCVAAAGNTGTDKPNWPAACDGVIAVGAIDESNERVAFSSYGPWVDVAAPGAAVYSSICQNYEFDLLSWIVYVLFFGYDDTNPYMFGDGTSFASPLVAGVCGLIRSKTPSLTPAQVAAQLVATGDVAAYSDSIGPRVNAFRALTQPVALGVGPSRVPGLSLEMARPNPFASATTVSFTLPQAAPVRLAIYDPTGRRVRLLVNAVLPSGRHGIRWDGADEKGRALSSGVYFATLESGSLHAARKLVLAR